MKNHQRQRKSDSMMKHTEFHHHYGNTELRKKKKISPKGLFLKYWTLPTIGYHPKVASMNKGLSHTSMNKGFCLRFYFHE